MELLAEVHNTKLRYELVIERLLEHCESQGNEFAATAFKIAIDNEAASTVSHVTSSLEA